MSNFINGHWIAGDGAAFSSINPASGAQTWLGAESTPANVDAAFVSARKAFPAWARLGVEGRIAIIEKFAALAATRKEELAKTISGETGKMLWDARGEAGAVAAKPGISIKSYAERTGKRRFDTAFGRAALAHRPHGVMAVLGPYNFPAHLPNGQIIPALIAGNTVVFKPSELTPATGAFLAALYQEAGAPPGVINLVQGGRDTGAAVLGHGEIDGVLFTGSASTGAYIHKLFGGRPEIILALEMGGNNPLLVWDTSDAQAAANLIIHSAFVTTGQRCTCARRLIIPDGPAGEQIIEALTAMMAGIEIGAGDEDAFMGPLISGRIAGHVISAANARAKKGRGLVTAKILPRGDAFMSPGLIDVSGADVPDEEIFGPILQVQRATDFGSAIQLANDTRFGLAAGLISDNEALWQKFSSEIRAGVVNFNRPTTGASGALPFGGPGASGNHNPGAYYAADFCAWPIASQIAAAPAALPAPGLPA